MKSIDHIVRSSFGLRCDRGGRRSACINPFNQPERRGCQDQDPGIDRGVRKIRCAASGGARDVHRAGRYLHRRQKCAALRKAGADGDLGSWLKAHLARSGADDYVALLAYIERDSAHIDALQQMRLEVRETSAMSRPVPNSGPRFLHSTGQAYKGGPGSGVFLQITSDDAKDLEVPGQRASFGVIKAAQARGDFDVLTERGRRALRVHLKGDLDAGLKMLDTAIQDALN